MNNESIDARNSGIIDRPIWRNGVKLEMTILSINIKDIVRQDISFMTAWETYARA
jgi:hypothetical protein